MRRTMRSSSATKILLSLRAIASPATFMVSVHSLPRLKVLDSTDDNGIWMEDIAITYWALAAIIVLNALMVVLTLGTKALRAFRKRRIESRTRRLEAFLDESLVKMKVHPNLRRLGGRD